MIRVLHLTLSYPQVSTILNKGMDGHLYGYNIQERSNRRNLRFSETQTHDS